MKLGSLEITLHRTVRVPDGRKPSNLPPSLGRMEAFAVKDYADKCPKTWEPEGIFVALHDSEAMWMSFTSRNNPVALLIGAGGINALNGEKLGTTLAKDNYVVTPPQPWLDGWKDQDGTVYQFVATPYKKGKGVSVAEQLIGEESKTGAIGIALFDPKDPKKLKAKFIQHEGFTDSLDSEDFKYPSGGSICYGSGQLYKSSGLKSLCSTGNEMVLPKARLTRNEARHSLSEMGIGRGGKIIQKVYSDPHGLEVWNQKPSATMAIYLVDAVAFEEITGKKVPKPVSSETYQGNWFGLNDKDELDVAGTGAFTGLKSAVFPGSDLKPEEIQAPVVKEAEE